MKIITVKTAKVNLENVMRNIRLLLVLWVGFLLTLMFSGCSSLRGSGGESKLLFNGKDLRGWREFIRGKGGGKWFVEDGILYTKGKGGGWLATTEEYDDFKLELDFRMSPGSNSGVFFRAPYVDNPVYKSLEVQLLDDYAKKHAKLEDWQLNGGIYKIKAPAKQVSKKAGEWQKMVLLCIGPKVQVTLNGERIIDIDLNDHLDKAKKFPGVKGRKGAIGLQNHNTRVDFRNMRITEL